MRGHALSGSRKLNKHWQSGSGGGPNWFMTGEKVTLVSEKLTGSSYDIRYICNDGLHDNGDIQHTPATKYIGGYYTSNWHIANSFAGKVEPGIINSSSVFEPGGGVKVTFKVHVPQLITGVNQYYICCTTDNLLDATINERLNYGICFNLTAGEDIGAYLYFADKPVNIGLADIFKDGKPSDEYFGSGYRTCYPIKNDKFVMYLRRGETSAFGYTQHFSAGISGLVYDKKLTLQDSDFPVVTYDGPNRKIKYKTTYEVISKDDPVWDTLYLGGKWYD